MSLTTTPTRRALKLAAPTYPNWQSSGSCRDHDDPETWFPIGENAAAQAQASEAVAVCWQCPVRAECLQFALDTRQDVGVWGGLTEQERRALHKRRIRRHDRGDMSALDHILTKRLSEFQELEARGLEPVDIARELGTNVQTVRNVRERLAQQAQAQAPEAVQAA